MRTLFRSLVLFALVAAVVASAGLSDAPARQKEKEEVGTIEVYQAKDGWRFRVKNAAGKSIAVGTTGHAKKEDCLKIVEMLKTTMSKAQVTEIKDNKKKTDKKKDDKK